MSIPALVHIPATERITAVVHIPALVHIPTTVRITAAVHIPSTVYIPAVVHIPAMASACLLRYVCISAKVLMMQWAWHNTHGAH